MERKLVRKVLQVDGMTCASCEMRIENSLKKLEGIEEAKVIYSSSNVYVTYDANVLGLDYIIETIENLDYTVVNGYRERDGQRLKKTEDKDTFSINQIVGGGTVLFALYFIVKNTVGFNFIPQVSPSMGYGILFAVGLLTSLHCIAMCGGISLSQCVAYKRGDGSPDKLEKLRPSFLYNAGRVASYTMIGGIAGAAGSAVSFSGVAKGIVAVISGVFMVIMGLNMLNVFPWLKKFNPRMPRVFGNRVYNNKGRHGPFYVGLLNGLMPCGPLQAMQIYALGTGSFLAGAMSMFMFSMGTVPLMFGFGALSSLLSHRFTKKMLKASAVLVIVLGAVMINRGLALSGINVAFTGGEGSVAVVDGGMQSVTTTLESGAYRAIIVQKGIPLKWTIKAGEDDLNGCNNPIVIPKYNIQKELVPGDNIIEFTPEEEGNITYACWMGMIRSNIKVVPDITNISEKDVLNAGAGGMAGRLGSCCTRRQGQQ